MKMIDPVTLRWFRKQMFSERTKLTPRVRRIVRAYKRRCWEAVANKK